MFDSEVASILVESKTIEENIIEFKATHNRAELSVITFLDVYFKGKLARNLLCVCNFGLLIRYCIHRKKCGKRP